jgi:leader peptidase (prepilin peptidase)/N-methyltransferase
MSSFDLVAIDFPYFFPTLVFIIGLCVGSFLNVCIYRMPRGLSVATPGSFCPVSNTPLKWWENIPVLSFIFLGGKGRISKQQISFQYPIVEIITGIIFCVLWLKFPPGVAISYMAMSAIFLAGSFIDWQFKIIPDSFTIGGTFLALVACVIVPQLHGVDNIANLAPLKSLGIGLQGMLIGSAIVLWMAILGEIAFKREAMGFGDVKLMGMIGGFLGWQATVFSLFGGAFIGLFVIGGMVLVEKFSGKKEKFFGREIPFGPMLCAAAFIYIWIKPMIVIPNFGF